MVTVTFSDRDTEERALAFPAGPFFGPGPPNRGASRARVRSGGAGRSEYSVHRPGEVNLGAASGGDSRCYSPSSSMTGETFQRSGSRKQFWKSWAALTQPATKLKSSKATGVKVVSPFGQSTAVDCRRARFGQKPALHEAIQESLEGAPGAASVVGDQPSHRGGVNLAGANST